MIETRKRTLVRTVVYRLFALSITSVITGLPNAVIIHVILTGFHYAYERLWARISWGFTPRITQPSYVTAGTPTDLVCKQPDHIVPE